MRTDTDWRARLRHHKTTEARSVVALSLPITLASIADSGERLSFATDPPHITPPNIPPTQTRSRSAHCSSRPAAVSLISHFLSSVSLAACDVDVYCCVGAIFAGFLTDGLGRWLTIVLTDLAFIGGGTILFFAPNQGIGSLGVCRLQHDVTPDMTSSIPK